MIGMGPYDRTEIHFRRKLPLMRFQSLPLHGAFLVEIDKREDERGFFARIYCEKEFAGQGAVGPFVQSNMSLSAQPYTLRGMHYQIGESAENKYVRCLRGRTYNVIVDVRPDSPTFLQHHVFSLSAEKGNGVYVPRGFANGMMTLEPNTELLYMVTNYYDPARERGLRWNDPLLGIEWPHEPAVMSNKDRVYPDYDPAYHLGR